MTTVEPYMLEEKVLKAIFKRTDAIVDAYDTIREEMFTVKDYAYIYKAMLEVYKTSDDVNNENVKMWLEDNNVYVTNIDIVDKLYNESYTSINIKSTCNIIKELYRRRTILAEVSDFVDSCRESSLSSDEILERVNDIAMKANERFSNNSELNTQVDCDGYLANMISLLKNPEDTDRVKTGWSSIDHNFGGLKRGWLVNFTGDSGAGKSYWSNQTALKICRLQPELYVDIYSLEMNKEENTGRLVSILSGYNSRELESPHKYFDRIDETTGEIYNIYDKYGDLHPEVQEYMNRVKNATHILSNSNIHIDDTPDLRIEDVEARAKKNHLKRGRTDVIIIDHTDLLHDGDPAKAVGEITRIYTRLKKLAKKLNCVIITLHQFSNEIKEGDRRPSVFSLRGAGTIRHNCDLIMLLYRPAIYSDLIRRVPELKDVCDISFEKVRNFSKPEPQNMKFFDKVCGFEECTTMDDYEEVIIDNIEPDDIPFDLG